ncbi:MAG: ABC transporter substrate-binding protein [Acidobacteria bacterium]|nr:ABC transporter substrate-binding protein [Acidobacteriota bacterium]MCI0720857.1 ABC transporter substrate-binding protein [Acidobacteriota bacterium]
MKKFVVGCLFLLLVLLGYQQYRLNRTVQAPDIGSQRFISLSPTLTEILFELGAGEDVVAVTTYCVYPEQAKTKEKIGDFVNPNFEKMVGLKPGVIFAETWSSSKIVSRLRDSGLNVKEVKSPRSIEEIYQAILQVGEGLHKKSRANEVVADMKRRIEAIRATAARMKSHPSIYVEIDLPTWTVGRASYTSEGIELCGTRNIFNDVDKPALQASKEAIIERNPDIILTFDSNPEEYRKRPGWQKISAIRKGWVIGDVGRNMLSHGNHRLVAGMEQLQARLLELQARDSEIKTR